MDREKKVGNGEVTKLVYKMVKDVTSQILLDGVEVRRRWAEYFEQVLNVEEVSEAHINLVANIRTQMLEELNERWFGSVIELIMRLSK